MNNIKINFDQGENMPQHEKATDKKPSSSGEKDLNRNTSLTSLRTSTLSNAAISISNLFSRDNLDLTTLVKQLGKQQNSTLEGGTNLFDCMLINQAQTLQALFHYAAERISHTNNLDCMQAFSDLALKANNNCRKTLLALQQIQKPSKTTFIKQQNNATNQQINTTHNNQPSSIELKKSNNFKNELLTEKPYETLDYGRTEETIRTNTPMETVATINGSKNGRGER